MDIEFEDRDKPLFMISAAAKMVAVHPQTLRLYERVGLIGPQRTKGKRLYSFRDVEQLRFIQNLTRDRGVNLAGVKVIIEFQHQLDQLQQEMQGTLETLKKRFYEEPDLFQNISERSGNKAVRIKIERG